MDFCWQESGLEYAFSKAANTPIPTVATYDGLESRCRIFFSLAVLTSNFMLIDFLVNCCAVYLGCLVLRTGNTEGKFSMTNNSHICVM